MLSVTSVVGYIVQHRALAPLCVGAGVLLWGASGSSALAQCATASQAQQFLASKATEGLSNNFGSTIKISGNTAAVATRYQPENPGNTDGRVDVYVRTGNGQQWELQQTLHPSIIPTDQWFGESMAIDGDTIVVCATAGGSGGGAYVFTRTGSVWSEQQILTQAGSYAFGWGAELLGDRLVVSDNGVNNFHGRSYYYTRSGGLNGTWTLAQTISAPSDAWYSNVAAMTTDTMAISEFASNSATNGRVRIYLRTGNTWALQQVVQPSLQYFNDRFGFSVSLVGNTMLVGAPQFQVENDPNTVNWGAAFVFSRSGTTWTQTGNIYSPTPVPNEQFGASVALTSNEAFAAIGASGDTDNTLRGSAYTFRLTAGPFWTYQNHIVPDGGGNPGDRIGSEIAVSGTSASATVLVGALALSSNSKPCVYSFQTTTTSFNQTQQILQPLHERDNLGTSVAIDGDWAVVGVPRAELITGSGSGTTTITDTGEARVYRRVNGTWTLSTTLTPPGLLAGSQFGYSVAINGTRIAVGAPYMDPSGIADAGMAYVYSLSGSTWTLNASLSASDHAVSDRFGWSVSLYDTTLIVGAPGDNNGAGTDAGAAYVYSLSSGVWGSEVKLLTQDLAAGDGFGTAVAALSSIRLVISSPNDDDQGTNSGSAYLFHLQPIINGQAWTQVRKFVAADGAASDAFGSSLAINGFSAIAIGAPLNNSAATDAGAVYVFTNTSVVNANTFDLGAKVTATSGAASDRFGTSVDFDNGTLIVGAPLTDTAGSSAGSAYMFRKSGGVWVQQQVFRGSDTSAGDNFGAAVGISGDTILCGAPLDDNLTGTLSGAAYFFDYSNTTASIIANPVSVNVCRRTSNATFLVGVSGGGPYTYVWKRNGTTITNLAGEVSGAGTFALTIIGVSPSDLGTYTCTVSNPCGGATSGGAALTACYADYDCSGTVAVADIFDFLSGWFAGSPPADINGVGGITVQDIFDFLAAWFAGC